MEETEERPPNTTTCSFCEYTFSNELPHFSCNKLHKSASGFAVCQLCFYDWAHGDRQGGDNVGFRPLRCVGCQQSLDFSLYKEIMRDDQFDNFDRTITQHTLEKISSVIYCPGLDCQNAFFKPKRSRGKRQCRRSVCDSCETVFCCRCGELYTKEHQRMKCGPYKQWKKTNDKETISIEEWKRGLRTAQQMKKCPGCRRDVEKNGGCPDMHCTNCRMHFCWHCGKPFKNRICACPRQ